MTINCVLSGVTLRIFLHDSLKSSPLYPTNITRSIFFWKFVPIGLLFGADITLTNVSFRFISVSLTEVIKSSIPALIFMINLVRGRDETASCGLRIAKCLNVVLICAGVAFTAMGEVDFEIRGFIAAVGATIAATAKLIFIERLLTDSNEMMASIDSTHTVIASPKLVRVTPTHTPPSEPRTTRTKKQTEAYAPISVDDSSVDTDCEIDLRRVKPVSASPAHSLNGGGGAHHSVIHSEGIPPIPVPSPSPPAHIAHGRLHPMLSLFYFTPVSAIALLPCQLIFERASLAESKFIDAGMWETTLLLIVIGSLVAFGLNASELFVIQETSALTLCIFGVLKFLIIIVISVMIFNYQITDVNRIGIGLAVLGLIVYNWVKWKESQLSHHHHHHHLDRPSSPMDEDSQSTGHIDLALDNEGHRHQYTHAQAIPRRHIKPADNLLLNGAGLSSSSGHDSSGHDSNSSSNASSVGSIESLLPRTPKTRASINSLAYHAAAHVQTSSANEDGSTAHPTHDLLGSRLRDAFNAIDNEQTTTDEENGNELQFDDNNHTRV